MPPSSMPADWFANPGAVYPQLGIFGVLLIWFLKVHGADLLQKVAGAGRRADVGGMAAKPAEGNGNSAMPLIQTDIICRAQRESADRIVLAIEKHSGCKWQPCNTECPSRKKESES